MDGTCSKVSGRVAPVIDRNRCAGKDDCVQVCPQNVFELGQLAKDQRTGLSVVGKLKTWIHDGRQAFVVRPEACHACKLCLTACPEKAIKLQPLPR